jgi:hypothetical protein
MDNFDKILNYVDHVIETLEPIVSKRRPNWGYVEKFAFAEQIIKLFGYLIVSDEEIIEKANEILDGTE